MPDGFTVTPEVMERFAGTSDDRAGDLTDVRGRMDGIRVGRDAFGHIPFLGSQIYDAYDEHVAACEELVTEAAGAMSAVASGIRAVVTEFVEGDRQAGDDLEVLNRAMDGSRFVEGS